MQVVIDIPDGCYEELKTASFPVQEAYRLVSWIKDGTPLPKGHGRLIDADEIQFENTEFDTYGDYCIAFDAIDDALTIIEADKAGERK